MIKKIKEKPMKKILLTIVLIALFQSFLFAGGPSVPMFNYDKIKTIFGDFKECVLSSESDGVIPSAKALAVYDEKGHILTFRGNYDDFTKFIYNSAGNILEIHSGFIVEGSAFSPTGIEKFFYDDNGKLSKIETYDGKSEKPVMTRNAYDYDKNGNYKVETTGYGKPDVFGYEQYNKEGILLGRITFDQNPATGKIDKDKISSKYSFKYDKNWNLITKVLEIFIHNMPGEPDKVTWQYSYKYDKNGNKISDTCSHEPSDVFMFVDPYFKKTNYAYNITVSDSSNLSNNIKKEETNKTEDMVNKKVEVEWNGAWYPAVILKTEGEKYFIHYDGYENSWDEWVDIKRIRF